MKLFKNLRYFLISKYLKSEDVNKRRLAIHKLMKKPDLHMLNGIVKALCDEDGSVRFGAIASLGNLKHPLSVSPLMNAYQYESDAFNRFYILMGLHELGEPLHFDLLFKEIKEVEQIDVMKNYDWDDLQTFFYTIKSVSIEDIRFLEESTRDPNQTIQWFSSELLDTLRENENRNE